MHTKSVNIYHEVPILDIILKMNKIQIALYPDKGKVLERGRRKAVGLRQISYDCQAAGEINSL